MGLSPKTKKELRTVKITGQTLGQLEDIEIDGIDMKDYPDFCDAFLSYATIGGRELTEEELEYIQETYSDWVYEQALESLH